MEVTQALRDQFEKDHREFVRVARAMLEALPADAAPEHVMGGAATFVAELYLQIIQPDHLDAAVDHFGRMVKQQIKLRKQAEGSHG